jgi:hypothetical protein
MSGPTMQAHHVLNGTVTCPRCRRLYRGGDQAHRIRDAGRCTRCDAELHAGGRIYTEADEPLDLALKPEEEAMRIEVHMTPDQLEAFTRWLDAWWRNRHPKGGGVPPTLQEAFLAGWGEAGQRRSLFDGHAPAGAFFEPGEDDSIDAL